MIHLSGVGWEHHPELRNQSGAAVPVRQHLRPEKTLCGLPVAETDLTVGCPLDHPEMCQACLALRTGHLFERVTPVLFRGRARVDLKQIASATLAGPDSGVFFPSAANEG